MINTMGCGFPQPIWPESRGVRYRASLKLFKLAPLKRLKFSAAAFLLLLIE